jgi:hypothetical protein
MMGGLEDLGPAFLTHRGPAEAGEPRQRALHGLAVPTEPLTAIDPALRDPVDNAAVAAGTAAAG